MGFFSYAYISRYKSVEDRVTATREIYSTTSQERVLLTWEPGSRPPGLHPYAGGHLLSSEPLERLPGYPRESCLASADDYPGAFLVEEGFRPKTDDSPVLFFVALPAGFVPAPKERPFEHPADPFVDIRDNHLVLCYAVSGPAVIRFWIRELEDDDSLERYDLNRIMTRPTRRVPKLEAELNFGIAKLRISS
ncbi:MAG: hypothetical protein WEG36_07125 [Gemmatimonadota bacterium]